MTDLLDTTGIVSRGDKIHEVYQRALFNILRGSLVKPRGRLTREILNHMVILEDVRNNVLVSPARNLNYRFMVAEWMWMLLGMEDVETISQYNSKIRKYSDDGSRFSGAYGPMISKQIEYVISNLICDMDSRQAVISIWRPNPPKSLDIPCTVAFQFLVRGGRLNLIVTMRSSDAWLGLPYDMYNFSQICSYVADLVEQKPGFLVMNLGSSHVYAEDWEKIQSVIAEKKSYTLRTPKLDRIVTGMPAKILRHPDKFRYELFDDENFPWKYYGAILSSKNSSEALEILREMELKLERR